MANNRPPFQPNIFYHAYNRAVGDESIFYEDKNYKFFLSKVDLYVCPVADIFAFCLMPNHFHFVVRVKGYNEVAEWWKLLDEEKKKSAERLGEEYPTRIFNFEKVVAHQFGTLQNSYTKSLNMLYSRNGGLFSQSIQRKLIKKDMYLKQAINYVHRNPVHHGFCKHPNEWKYSSFNSYLSTKKTKVNNKEGLLLFGSRIDFLEYTATVDEIGYGVEMRLYY